MKAATFIIWPSDLWIRELCRALRSPLESCGAAPVNQNCRGWEERCERWKLALDWLTFLINITLGFLYTNYIQRYTTILTNARMHFKHSHLIPELSKLVEFCWRGRDFNEGIKAWSILNLSYDLALSIKCSVKWYQSKSWLYLELLQTEYRGITEQCRDN